MKTRRSLIFPEIWGVRDGGMEYGTPLWGEAVLVELGRFKPYIRKLTQHLTGDNQRRE